MEPLPQTDPHSVEFLLSELDHIEADRLRLRNEASQRLNSYLTLTSAVVAALAFVSQAKATLPLRDLSLLGGLFLSFIGWHTFRFSIDRDVLSDHAIRAGGRIRRFFTSRDTTIQPHLLWHDGDSPSHYITHNTSGIRRVVAGILASVLGCTVAVAASYLPALGPWVPAVLGLLAFPVSLTLLSLYALWRFRLALRKVHDMDRVLFPNLTAVHPLSSHEPYSDSGSSRSAPPSETPSSAAKGSTPRHATPVADTSPHA